MDVDNQSKGKQLAISAGVIVVIALMIVGVLASNNKSGAPVNTAKSSTASPVSPPPSVSKASNVVDVTQAYKAGSYQATGSYDNPSGVSAITVSVTIDAKGTVIDSTAAEGSGSQESQEAKNRESQEYEQRFIGGYKPLIIGKKITDISLSRVSGSSLTSNGFNDAIKQIEQKAHA